MRTETTMLDTLKVLLIFGMTIKTFHKSPKNRDCCRLLQTSLNTGRSLGAFKPLLTSGFQL